ELGTPAFLPGYRQMFEAGYKAIHEADPGPKCQVLLGEFLGSINPKQFLDAMLKPGPIVAEGLALHPYQDNTLPWNVDSKDAWDLGDLDKGQATLRSYRSKLHTPSGAPLPLYLTEFGFFPQEAPYPSEATRATWLTDAFKIAQKAGAKQLLQYQIFETPTANW